MALITNIETEFGESKSLYLRINSANISNHGVESVFLIRGYTSQEAFTTGARFMHEEEVVFIVDVTKNLWQQCYTELKKKYVDSVDVME